MDRGFSCAVAERRVCACLDKRERDVIQAELERADERRPGGMVADVESCASLDQA